MIAFSESIDAVAGLSRAAFFSLPQVVGKVLEINKMGIAGLYGTKAHFEAHVDLIEIARAFGCPEYVPPYEAGEVYK